MYVPALMALISAAVTRPYWTTGYYISHDGLDAAGIPWAKYTHMVHSQVAMPGVDGAGMGDGTLRTPVPWPGYSLAQADKDAFVKAAHAAKKKAVVSIIDNAAHPEAFAQATAPGRVAAFVNSIAALVQNGGNPYDGVDIDWEARGDAAGFERLIAALRAALPSPALILAAGSEGEPFPAMARAAYPNLDQINIMCYDLDYHAADRSYSWFNSALISRDSGQRACAAPVISALVAAGVPRSKIGVGIPFYGRRWTGCTAPLRPCKQSPQLGPYSSLVEDGARWHPQYRVYDARYKANYLSIGPLNEFVAYTGPEQIRDIVAWVKEQGLGGVMCYAVQYEAYYTRTGFPLTNAVYDALRAVSSSNR